MCICGSSTVRVGQLITCVVVPTLQRRGSRDAVCMVYIRAMEVNNALLEWAYIVPLLIRVAAKNTLSTDVSAATRGHFLCYSSGI